MSKKYPISDSKLSKLKANGIVVRSQYLFNSIKFFLFTLCSYFITSFNYSNLSLDLKSLELNDLSIIFKILALFIFAMIIANFLFFIFSKFYFNISIAQPRFTRFSRSRNMFSLNSFFHLICLLLLLLISYQFYLNFFDQFLQLDLTSSYSSIKYQEHFELISVFSLKISTVFLIFGLCSYLIHWLSYRFDHMMTEEEYQAEIREQQSSAYRA